MTERTTFPASLAAGLALALTFAMVPSAPAAAATEMPAATRHVLGQSYLFTRIYEDSVTVRFEITLADVNRGLSLGWVNPDDIASREVLELREEIRAWAESHFSFGVNGEPLNLEFRDFEVVDRGVARYAAARYRLAPDRTPPPEVEIEFTTLFDVDPDHRNMVIVEHNWRTGTFNAEANVALIFGPSSGAQSLDLVTGSVLQGFIAMVWQGVWHIWIGTDHILFLLALLLPAVLVRREGRWEPAANFREAFKNLLVIVTMFTIAHSVTLSLAAFDVVSLSSRVVESIIAASIAAAAWANLNPRLSIREWTIALLFGLFHGFGFASVLGDLGLGGEHLVLSLLGFNVGVELGQLAIVAVVFPVLFFLRSSSAYRYILRVGSYLLIAVALVWVYERVFDVDVWLTRLLLSPVRWIVG